MPDINGFKSIYPYPLTIQGLINAASLFLIENNILNGKNEIEWYLQYLYRCDRMTLLSLYKAKIDESRYNQTINFLSQRVQKVPFQYIVGEGTFYGRDYLVDNSTLIPRPETELLISIIKDKKCDKLLDIGTGTGCVGITASIEGIAQSVDLIDINKKALSIAKKNSERFQIKNTSYFQLDILNELPSCKYDIVVSNPPYISQNEYNLLDCEVKNYEPNYALTDKSDGYTFYKRYASILNIILKNKGIAVFEISHFFSRDKLSEIFKNFSNIHFHKDLNGDYRALSIING